MTNLTTLQEIYFDICDLLDNDEINDIAISGFEEFKTLKEFLTEQKAKLEKLEEALF